MNQAHGYAFERTLGQKRTHNSNFYVIFPPKHFSEYIISVSIMAAPIDMPCILISVGICQNSFPLVGIKICVLPL